MITDAFKILIVDDEPDLLELIADTFEIDGFKAFSATGVNEALSILENRDFDAIISDYLMPDVSGLDFLSLVQQRYHKSEMPLFYFSTGMSDVSLDKVGPLGVSRIFVKPFELNELVEIVKSDIEEKRSLANE